MINILIVDDDPIIRNTFQKMIDWEGNGFNLCAKARNGAEALEILKNTEIDIVITDVKMPVMDGLTFIKHAKEINQGLIFVVLSGYDEFALVNEAYRLGASEYLLKMEMNPKDVLELLLNLADESKKEKAAKLQEIENLKKMQKMEKILLLNKQTLREKLLKEFVWGHFSKELDERLREENILIDENNISLMVLELKNYYTVEKQDYNGDRELLGFAVANVFEEVLANFDNIYYFANLPHEFVLIFPSLTMAGEKKLYDDIHNIFRAIQKGIGYCFDITINGGFHSASSQKTDRKQLFQQAQAACKYSFVTGNGRLNIYRYINNEEKSDFIDVDKKLKGLRDVLKLINYENVIGSVETLKINDADITFQNISAIKKLYSLYYYEFLNFSKQNNVSRKINELLLHYEEVLSVDSCLKELNDWVESLIREIAGIAENAGIIDKAKSFIQANYSTDVTLSVVAEHLKISKSHLSRIFAREANMSFTRYLIQVRIDEAIRLTRNTNLKVYEIAKAVGYTSVEQFSRTFKKVTGKYPKEYMK